MKSTGTHFNRVQKSLIIAVLVIILVIPAQRITAEASIIQNDEFSGSSLNASIWSVTHTESGSTISVTNNELRLTVPAGDAITFSNTNKKAPRVLQAISDADFAVEVKFNSSMNVYQDDKIQGILVFDQSANKWLRFDFNTDSDSLNTYIGFIDQAGTLHHIENVTQIATSHPDVPLYLRVQYTKSDNTWTMFYRIGDTGDFVLKKTFTEASIPNLANFAPTHIGLFAGSTGDDKPGHVMRADYFRSVAQVEPPDLNERIYLPIITR